MCSQKAYAIVVELERFSTEVGLPSAELRALPRAMFRKIVQTCAWKREFSSRIVSMQGSSRLAWYANELKTQQLRFPKLTEWRAAGYVAHVSSRYHIRLLAMTRLGLLPVETETGRWSGTPRDERLCTRCHMAIGDISHFLRECTALKTPACPHWDDNPNEKLGGFWWRSVVHKLDVRWNEKCAINRDISLQ